jgi:hypothetical protein
MENNFSGFIIFSYVMQSLLLLAHINSLGLIPPKHGVIFPQCGFFNFHAKTYGLYLETEEVISRNIKYT